MLTFEKKSDLLNQVRETCCATKDKRLQVEGHGQFISPANLIEVLRAIGLIEWKEDDLPEEEPVQKEGLSFARILGR